MEYEALMKETKDMSEELLAEVLDFARFLKTKAIQETSDAYNPDDYDEMVKDFYKPMSKEEIYESLLVAEQHVKEGKYIEHTKESRASERIRQKYGL